MVQAQREARTVARVAKAGERDDEGPAFLEAFNELCNRVVRTLLAAEAPGVAELKIELKVLQDFFVKSGNQQAALLVRVFRSMAEHQMPSEAEGLQGIYRDAFVRVLALVEDSGWHMAVPDQDESDDDAGPAHAVVAFG